MLPSRTHAVAVVAAAALIVSVPSVGAWVLAGMIVAILVIEGIAAVLRSFIDLPPRDRSDL